MTRPLDSRTPQSEALMWTRSATDISLRLKLSKASFSGAQVSILNGELCGRRGLIATVDPTSTKLTARYRHLMRIADHFVACVRLRRR